MHLGHSLEDIRKDSAIRLLLGGIIGKGAYEISQEINQRMVDYSLALLNVMYPVIYSRDKIPLNEAYLRGVQNIRETLI